MRWLTGFLCFVSPRSRCRNLVQLSRGSQNSSWIAQGLQRQETNPIIKLLHAFPFHPNLFFLYLLCLLIFISTFFSLFFPLFPSSSFSLPFHFFFLSLTFFIFLFLPHESYFLVHGTRRGSQDHKSTPAKSQKSSSPLLRSSSSSSSWVNFWSMVRERVTNLPLGSLENHLPFSSSLSCARTLPTQWTIHAWRGHKGKLSLYQQTLPHI